MNTGVKNIIIFATGAATGVGAAYVGLKKYFGRIADEEIASVKLSYADELEELKDEIDRLQVELTALDEPVVKEEKPKTTKKKSTRKKKQEEYDEMVEKLNYNQYSYEEGTGSNGIRKPYIISPDDFANELDFDKVTLTYCDGDETFVDINGEIVHEGEALVGEDNMDDFGKFEEGVLYVRNETFGADYEVIFDSRTYADYIEE